MSAHRCSVVGLSSLLCALAGCSGGDAPAVNGDGAGPGAPGSESGSSGGGGDGGKGASDGGPTGADGGKLETDAGADGGKVAPVLSAGCASATLTTGEQSKTMMIGGVMRKYLLVVPATATAGKPLSFVFGFHGYYANGPAIRSQLGLEPFAAGAAIFVYPDAITSSTNEWDLSSTGNDLAFFDALETSIEASHCVDKRRVFAAGFSGGAFMTNAVGCHRGDHLRAIAPIAGHPVGSAATCKGAVAAFVVHGTEDTTVDYTSQGLPSRDEWVKASACTATSTSAVAPSPCVAYGGCAAGKPVHWCSWVGAHAIPSFAKSGAWSFFASFD